MRWRRDGRRWLRLGRRDAGTTRSTPGSAVPVVTIQGSPPGGMDAQRDALVAATGGTVRDPAALARSLEPWLAPRLGARGVAVSGLERPAGAGVSNETFLFRATWEERGATRGRGLVLRFKPTTVRLFPDDDFEEQYRLLDTLHRHRLVRVPQMLWLCQDDAPLGAPFFVMERLEGRVPVSAPVYNTAGFLFEATPAQRRTAWTSAVEELARVHRVPVELVRFVAQPGETGNGQQVDYWERYLAWSLGADAPDRLLALGEWVRAACPGPGPAGLSWGDARIGNMMFDDDFRLVGVMDWEQMSLGGCRHDLAWWLLFDDFHSAGQGVARLDGLGSRSETIGLWEELTGEQAGDLRWYEAFAGLKLALIAARTFAVGGRPPSEAGALASALAQRACELAGIE